jgi:hypothetical protein
MQGLIRFTEKPGTTKRHEATRTKNISFRVVSRVFVVPFFENEETQAVMEGLLTSRWRGHMLPALGLASLSERGAHVSPDQPSTLILNFITEDVMKQLLRICAGLILVLALSLPAFAGEILTPPVAGPQESPGVMGPQESPGFAGDMGAPGLTGDIQAPGFMGDIGCPGLLAAFFSLF